MKNRYQRKREVYRNAGGYLSREYRERIQDVRKREDPAPPVLPPDNATMEASPPQDIHGGGK